MKELDYSIVRKEINQWDPIGLIGLGCPEDEYEREVQEIVCADCNSVELLSQKINQLFIHYFEAAYIEDTDKCNEIACKIFQSTEV